MKKELAIAALSLALTLGMTTLVSADDVEDQESDIDVEVSGQTLLDVRPSSLNYDGLEPGDFEEVSEDDFFALEISNIGSEEINQISARSTMPSTNPFGTGTDDEYDAGNFIKVSTDTANNGDYDDIAVTDSDEDVQPHFLDRLEFEENPAPTYIQTSEDDDDALDEINTDIDGVDVGRFRAGGEEYFYSIYHTDDGSGACSDDPAELWVGTEEHTSTELGTFDFTINDEDGIPNDEDVEVYSITGGTGDGDVGVADSTVSIGDEEYTIYTYCDGTSDGEPGHTIRTRFNVEVTSPVLDSDLDENTDTGPSRYILDDNQGGQLQPGASFPLDIGVQVPLGVAQGDMDQGTLTVEANSGG